MNRARRDEIRKNAELRKAQARAHADHVERARRVDAAAATLRAHNERVASASHVADGDAFLSIVKERSPVLVVPELVPILRLVASLPHARPVREWAPRAKGRTGRLVSLFEHLFATVPVPSVVWAGLFDDASTIAPLVVWLASGGSFFQYAKSRLPIPLTRKCTCNAGWGCGRNSCESKQSGGLPGLLFKRSASYLQAVKSGACHPVGNAKATKSVSDKAQTTARLNTWRGFVTQYGADSRRLLCRPVRCTTLE